MRTIEIKNSYTGAVLFSTQVDDADEHPVRTALARAVAAHANLAHADLARADLARANLADADLARANLAHADLADANLARANLAHAYLAGANLARANLAGANLARANLARANLAHADLARANLARANLARANLAGVRSDIRAILDQAPHEVAGLLGKLRSGQINGSCYEGECACLVGTIAKVRGCHYEQLGAIRPDSSRPAERWFLALQPGHTPDNHQVAEITERWICEWLTDHGVPVPPRPHHLEASELAELRAMLGGELTERGAELLTKLGWVAAPQPSAP